MSTLEEMKTQLKMAEYVLTLILKKPMHEYTTKRIDSENRIWTLQQRIRDAEDREAICEEVYPVDTKEQGYNWIEEAVFCLKRYRGCLPEGSPVYDHITKLIETKEQRDK